MLRLIQEQRFERVGGDETVQTDVRLIAATNADLEKMADDGRFRKDLYFRLNVFTIHLPPLRDRGDDVGLLIDHFLTAVRPGTRQAGARRCAPEALAALRAYPWPGNVRELQSVLKQSLLQMRGSVLLADFLPAHVRRPPAAAPADAAPAAAFDWDEFVGGRIAAGTREPVRREPGADGAGGARPGAAAHRREPAPGGPHPRHHPRQPAEQDPRPGHQHRPVGLVRRRPG